MKKLIALFVLALALAGFFYWRHAAQPVAEVMPVQRGKAVYAIYGTAKVVPILSFSLRVRTGGVLKYSDRLMPVTNLVGLSVKSGELLGQVVNETLDRDFAKAEAEWSAAQERQKLGPGGAPSLKTQEALVMRMQKLVALSNVPPSEVEHAVNDLTTAREIVRQQEIEIDRATTVAKQEYDNLRLRKEQCKFISPMDGFINGVNGVNGEFMAEGGVPFVIVTRDNYLEGQINEEDVGHVGSKMKASVKLYAYPDEDIIATVTQIVPGANNQRYTVNFSFDKPPPNLMAGQTGELNIISGTREHALLIPARALLVDKVWVIQDGIAKPRRVKTGFRNIEQAEILEGLTDGELVVLADQDLLHAGEHVRPLYLNP